MFPIIDGVPRMLLPPMRDALLKGYLADGLDTRQIATASSFGFEWNHFSEMYNEWGSAFLEYMQPHGPDFFRGKRVLDAGCGSGRYAYYAAKYGAEVWAVDLGPAVDVAERNAGKNGNVRSVQADLYKLPFALESFDFIYSIGVLHHLSDPEAGFHNLLRYLKPGGEIQIYLYWNPEDKPIKRAMLSAIAVLRRFTTRLPHCVIYALSYPAAAAARMMFVWPYQIMKHVPGMQEFASAIPMRQYAAYPFRVCVNDQFDRFSAPIENRYTRDEVESWLNRANLECPILVSNYGWVANGRKWAGAALPREPKIRALASGG
jgi:SAM-dependent methyltransferase